MNEFVSLLFYFFSYIRFFLLLFRFMSSVDESVCVFVSECLQGNASQDDINDNDKVMMIFNVTSVMNEK